MKKELKRSIGVLQLVIFYFSTIVGVGIFVVPLQAAKKAGPASIISWIVVLMFAYPFAMIYARISQRYKVSGSIQKFVEEVAGIKYGQTLAIFLVMTALFGDTLLGFSAARYLIEIADIKSHMAMYIIGPTLLLLPVLMNLQAVARSSKIQTFTLITLIVLVEVIVLSAVPHYEVSNLTPFTPNGNGAVLAAIVICFYSIVGWENVDAMAEEVVDPAKTYGRAIKYSLILISLFYISIVATVILVLDTHSINSSNTILTALLTKIFGQTAGVVGGVIAIVLLMLGANAWVFGTSRFIYALARDKVLPDFLTKFNKNSVPYNAVLIQMVFYVIISLIMAALHLDEGTIIEMASLNYLMLYSFVFYCGIKGFTTGRLKMLSGAAMLVAIFFLVQSSNENIIFSIVSLILCASYILIAKKKLIKQK